MVRIEEFRTWSPPAAKHPLRLRRFTQPRRPAPSARLLAWFPLPPSALEAEAPPRYDRKMNSLALIIDGSVALSADPQTSASGLDARVANNPPAPFLANVLAAKHQDLVRGLDLAIVSATLGALAV